MDQQLIILREIEKIREIGRTGNIKNERQLNNRLEALTEQIRSIQSLKTREKAANTIIHALEYLAKWEISTMTKTQLKKLFDTSDKEVILDLVMENLEIEIFGFPVY